MSISSRVARGVHFGRGVNRDRRERDDGGFILVMMGLLIIPIMAFAALAIDVSSWYSRATELQRSADAAALTGVVWMPSMTNANSAADETLERNLIDKDAPNIAIAQTRESDYAYKVCVTDDQVTQFFGVLFGAPTTITRCAVAKYDEPLQIGSPLNFIGGANPQNFDSFPGQEFIPATPDTPGYGPAPTPPGNNPGIRPDNYDARVGSTKRGCKWVVSVQGGNAMGWQYGPGQNDRWPASTSYPGAAGNLSTRVAWSTGSGSRKVNHYATELPDCSWSTPVIPGDPGQPEIPAWSTIRSDMNPGFWLSVEAPGTDAVQGDRYATRCYGQGAPNNCVSNGRTNPEYDENGHYFSLSINENSPTLIQVFDAEFKDVGQSVGAGDNTLGNGAGTWTTHYQVLAPDDTPFDPTDNPVMGAAACGGTVGNNSNSGEWTFSSNTTYSNFENKWRTICTLSSPNKTVTGKSGYILRVWSTSTNNREGNASNSYALRAIATNNAAEVDQSNYPLNPLAAQYQPSFSPWQHMSIYVNVNNGSNKATFFLARVTSEYAGKTLVMELYDSAEGAQSVTVNNPFGVQKGCHYEGSKLRSGENGGGGGDGGTIGNGASANSTIAAGSNCTINTASTSYNGVLLKVKMEIPPDYTCDDSVRPGSTADSDKGCWWSITYNVKDPHDATTWGAYIEGNPIRLIQ